MSMSVQYALISLSLASVYRVVWIPAHYVMSVSIVRKLIAYYTLAALVALIPFGFLMLVMFRLAEMSLDVYEFTAVFVVLYGLYAIYLMWLFLDDTHPDDDIELM